MLDKSRTLNSLSEQDAFRRDYRRWEELHSVIMQEPPRGGRDYINHALKILPFIDAIAELHPISRAVVAAFKAVLNLEQIREENETRVAAVFLAGTDTMRVFLDISEVASSDRYSSTLHPINFDFGFETVLRRIQVTIKDCGNSIDAYYKQSRMAKFYKAQEWKDRMAGYIEDFKNHRGQLQDSLSLYTTSNVNVLVATMSDLVSRLFATDPDWEKTLTAKTQNLGDRSEWFESDVDLQVVISAAEDPVLGGISTKKIESKSIEMRNVQSTNLSELRDELQLSLDELCNRNMGIFESKLAFHTQQLQESIASSARFVVRTLSGPHDRLFHDDLRELWKEMSWIFCVDNKLFASALSEYYFDHFSTSRILPLDSDLDGNQEQRNPSKADTWTLEYIATYGHQITIAIDRDNSGFIRISEANAFTRAIPDGWSLPQWCAYTVAGWSYECRIYRKRMHQLMFKLMDMQAQVLPNNRAYLISIIEQGDPIFAPLAWEPRGQKLPPTTIELRSLVKDKVHTQDAAMRTHIESLQWNIEDQSVLRLLYGDAPLEKYILQLCTLVLEQSLLLAQVSCTLTPDSKEWNYLFYCHLTIKKVVLTRITSLSDDPKTYFGGIWSSVDLQNYRTYRTDDHIDYSRNDVVDYHHDLSLLDDFPLPSVEGEPRKYLKHVPWEEHIKSMNEVDIPLAIPDEWDPTVVKEGGSIYRTYWGRFPFTERMCDLCQGIPIVEHHYGCLTCKVADKFDLCASCYNNESPSELEINDHKVDHAMVKWTLSPRIGQRHWTDFEANLVLEELQTVGRVKAKNEVENEEDEDSILAAGAAAVAELGLDLDEIDVNESIGAELNGDENHNEAVNAEDQDPEVSNIDDTGSHQEAEDASSQEVEENLEGFSNEDSPTSSRFTCSRCAASISLETTFYRCVGHSCRDFFMCESCESVRVDSDANADGHHWWHSLLVLRKSLIEPVLEAPSTKVEITQAETQTVAGDPPSPDEGPHTALISAVVTRISAVEDKFHAALTAMEDKIDSTRAALESNLSSTTNLEERVTNLDDKITNLTTMLGDLIGRLNA